jgi:hypothetical protein
MSSITSYHRSRVYAFNAFKGGRSQSVHVESTHARTGAIFHCARFLEENVYEQLVILLQERLPQ